MEKKPGENKKQKREHQRWTPELEAVANGRGGNCRQESGGGKPNGRTAKLVPLEEIAEARERLLSVLRAPRKEVHGEIMQLRKDFPGRIPGGVLRALRRLRDDRGKARGKHAEWTAEKISRLKAAYARGLTDVRRARKELLTENPDWNRHTLNRQIRKLGIAMLRATARSWPVDQHGSLLYLSQEKSVKWLAARNNRSRNAIYVRLSRHGAAGRVRVHNCYTQREAGALLGVCHRTVAAWLDTGLLRKLSERALIQFCLDHPERVNRERCAAVVRGWLAGARDVAELDRNRAHLARQMTCPRCGRTVKGNGYYMHAKRCANQSSGSNAYLSISAVNVSSVG